MRKAEVAREGLCEEVRFNQDFGSSKEKGSTDSMHIEVKTWSQVEMKIYHWPSSSYLTWGKLFNHSVPPIPIRKMEIIISPPGGGSVV